MLKANPWGETVIVDFCMLAVIMGRNVHDKSYLVMTVNQGKYVRVNMSRVIPATEAAWVLYGKGPISNFFKILEKGDLSD